MGIPVGDPLVVGAEECKRIDPGPARIVEVDRLATPQPD
jgi:hypothetical protein